MKGEKRKLEVINNPPDITVLGDGLDSNPGWPVLDISALTVLEPLCGAGGAAQSELCG